MSEGRFLVGLKDPIRSGKKLQIKSLLKEDMDINEEVNISCSGEMEVMKLNTDIDSLAISLNAGTLSPDSTEVVVHIAGNTTKKYLKESQE